MHTGATATTLQFTLDTRYDTRLKGGDPCTVPGSGTLCPLCVEGVWDRNASAGYYVLLGEAGAATYDIVGPLQNTSGFLDVPARLARARELVATFFVYSQYPIVNGTTFDASGKCMQGNQNTIMIKSLVLLSRSTFSVNREPPASHPRLFGADADWVKNFLQPWETMPCDPLEVSDWGGVAGLRRSYDSQTARGKCAGSAAPATLAQHPVLAKYFAGTVTTLGTTSTDVLRTVHLLRRLRACHRLGIQYPLNASTSADPTGPGTAACTYSAAEVANASAVFMNREVELLPLWAWTNQGLVFDIGTYGPMRYWCLFLDTFWDDLSSAQRAAIVSKMSPLIDGFISEFETSHWAIMNGNNWTPYLCAAAMYWSVTFYHEDVRAPGVLHRLLDSMWLHGAMYKGDGVYQEGGEWHICFCFSL